MTRRTEPKDLNQLAQSFTFELIGKVDSQFSGLLKDGVKVTSTLAFNKHITGIRYKGKIKFFLQKQKNHGALKKLRMVLNLGLYTAKKQSRVQLDKGLFFAALADVIKQFYNKRTRFPCIKTESLISKISARSDYKTSKMNQISDLFGSFFKEQTRNLRMIPLYLFYISLYIIQEEPEEHRALALESVRKIKNSLDLRDEPILQQIIRPNSFMQIKEIIFKSEQSPDQKKQRRKPNIQRLESKTNQRTQTHQKNYHNHSKFNSSNHQSPQQNENLDHLSSRFTKTDIPSFNPMDKRSNHKPSDARSYISRNPKSTRNMRTQDYQDNRSQAYFKAANYASVQTPGGRTSKQGTQDFDSTSREGSRFGSTSQLRRQNFNKTTNIETARGFQNQIENRSSYHTNSNSDDFDDFEEGMDTKSIIQGSMMRQDYIGPNFEEGSRLDAFQNNSKVNLSQVANYYVFDPMLEKKLGFSDNYYDKDHNKLAQITVEMPLKSSQDYYECNLETLLQWIILDISGKKMKGVRSFGLNFKKFGRREWVRKGDLINSEYLQKSPYFFLAQKMSQMTNTHQLYFLKFVRMFFKVFSNIDFVEEGDVNGEDLFEDMVKLIFGSGGYQGDIYSGFFNNGKFFEQFHELGFSRDLNGFYVCCNLYSDYLNNNHGSIYIKRVLEKKSRSLPFHRENMKHLIGQFYLFSNMKFEEKYQFVKNQFKLDFRQDQYPELFKEFCLRMSSSETACFPCIRNIHELLEATKLSRAYFKDQEFKNNGLNSENILKEERYLINSLTRIGTEKFNDSDILINLVTTGSLTKQTSREILNDLQEEDLWYLAKSLHQGYKFQISEDVQDFLKEQVSVEKIRQHLETLIKIEVNRFFFINEVINLAKMNKLNAPSAVTVLRNSAKQVLNFDLDEKHIKQSILGSIRNEGRGKVVNLLISLIILSKDSTNTDVTACETEAGELYDRLYEIAKQSHVLLQGIKNLNSIFNPNQSENESGFNFLADYCINVDTDLKSIKSLLVDERNKSLTYQKLIEFQETGMPDFESAVFDQIIKFMSYGKFPKFLVFYMLKKPKETKFADFESFVSDALEFQKKVKTTTMTPSLSLKEACQLFKTILSELKPFFEKLGSSQNFTQKAYKSLSGLEGFGEIDDSHRRQIFKLMKLSEEQITHINDSIAFFKAVEFSGQFAQIMSELKKSSPNFKPSPEDKSYDSFCQEVKADFKNENLIYETHKTSIEGQSLKEYIKRLGDLTSMFKNIRSSFSITKEVKKNGGMKVIFEMTQSDKKEKNCLSLEEIKIVESLFANNESYFQDASSKGGLFGYCDYFKSKMNERPMSKGMSLIEFLSSENFENRKNSICDLMDELHGDDSTGLKKLSKLVSENCLYSFRLPKKGGYELFARIQGEKGKRLEENFDDLKFQYNKLLSFRNFETQDEKMKDIVEKIKSFLFIFDNMIPLLNDLNEIYEAGYVLDLRKAIEEICPDLVEEKGFEMDKDNFSFSFQLPEDFNPSDFKDNRGFAKARNTVQKILNRSKEEYAEITKNPKDRWILNLKGEQLRMAARYFLDGEQKKKVGNILKYCLGDEVDLDMFKTYNHKDSNQEIESQWSAIQLIKTFREQSDALRPKNGFPANNTSMMESPEEAFENIRNKMEFLVVEKNQFHYMTLYLVKNATTFNGFNKYLFCTQETKKEEIHSFLRRALQDEKKSQYAIFDTQRLTKENFDFLLMLIKKEFESQSIRPENLEEVKQDLSQNEIPNSDGEDLHSHEEEKEKELLEKDFNKNILFLVNLEEEKRNEITKQLQKLDKIFKECLIEELEDISSMNEDEKKDFDLSYRTCWRQDVEVVCSTFSGFGKSTYIDKRRAVSTPKLDMITLFVTAGMKEDSWNVRLKPTDNKLLTLDGDRKINLKIKVDIFDGHEDQIYKVDQILYQILNCDRLSFTDSYIFFERVEKVFIELSSSHTDILENTLSVVQVYRDKMEIKKDRDDYFYGADVLKEDKTRFYTKIQNILKKNIDLSIFRTEIEDFDQLLNYIWLARVVFGEKRMKAIQSVRYGQVFGEDDELLKDQEALTQISAQYPDDDQKKIDFLFTVLINEFSQITDGFKLKVKLKDDLGNFSFYQILNFLKLLNYYLKKFKKDERFSLENKTEGETDEKIYERRLEVFDSMVQVCMASCFLTTHRIRCSQFETRFAYLENKFKAKMRKGRSKLGKVKDYLNGPKFDISTYLSQPLFKLEKVLEKGESEEKQLKPFCKIHDIDENQEKIITENAVKNMSENGFVTVKDTYAKMHMLIVMAELGLPIMIQGQSGCGKTFLVKNTSEKILGDECLVKTLHNGFKESDLENLLLKSIKRAKELQAENRRLWLVFDEINTSPCQCLKREVMIERKITFLEKEIKIPKNLVLVGIANPYDRLKQNPAGKKRGDSKDQKNQLSHNVNPITDGLLNFAVDFEQLDEETERKYVRAKLMARKEVESICEKNHIEMITESIIICQNQIRALERISSVSLRDVERFIQIFLFFRNNQMEFEESLAYTTCLCYLLRIGSKQGKSDLVKAIDKKYKEIFNTEEEFNIEKKFNEKAQKIAEAVNRKNSFPNMIAINKALRENLFSILVCVQLKIPLMISGQPGTSKSVAVDIAGKILSAQAKNNRESEPDLAIFSQATMEYLWGSKSTTEHEIKTHHKKVLELANNNLKKMNEPNQMEGTSERGSKMINTVSVIEEIGQIQKAPGDPTKFLHKMVDSEESKDISIIAISNWRLDDSQNNRFIIVTRPDLDKEDLVQTSTRILEAIISKKYPRLKMDEELKTNKTILETVFNVLAEQYVLLREREILSKKDHPDFHGTRDFYTAIKYIIWKLEEEDFTQPEEEGVYTNFKKKIYYLIQETIEINFSGREEKLDSQLKKMLKAAGRSGKIHNKESALCSEIIKHLLWKELTKSGFIDDPLDALIDKTDFIKMPHKFQMITENLSLESDLARFLMLITDGEYTTTMLINKLREWHEKIKAPIIEQELQKEEEDSSEKEINLFNREFIVIENVETEEQMSKELARFPIYMKMAATVVMSGCDMMKSPLYDLFNQGDKEPGQQYYKCNLMIKGSTMRKDVHKYFRLIVLEKRGEEGSRESYQQLLPPFLNRFQKVLVKDKDLLMRLGNQVITNYEYFSDEADIELTKIMTSENQSASDKGKKLARDLMINNYSKNLKIGVLIYHEKIEQKISLVQMEDSDNILGGQKINKKQKKKEYDEVMKSVYSRNLLAYKANQIKDKDKEKLKKKRKKKFKEFSKLNNSKDLISYIESKEMEGDGLSKSLMFTYTHSSNIYTILDQRGPEISSKFSVVSVENLMKNKRAKQIEERLTTPGKSVLIIQFKGKDQWRYISEVKLILEEAIENIGKGDDRDSGEKAKELQIKSLIFLAHYSNEDLKNDEEVEIAINFFTKDWSMGALDKLEGYSMEKFLTISCETLSQVIWMDKGKFALDLVKILVPRSISRILESHAVTKDQKKVYKDIINTFKVDKSIKKYANIGEEERSNPGDKLCQKTLDLLKGNKKLYEKVLSIEGTEKRSIFDLILKYKQEILIEYTHDYMEGVATLIEKIIGNEFDYVVKKINDEISLKDRQIFEELEPFKRDQKVAEWEAKLDKIKIKKNEFEKMKRYEINPEEYFEKTTAEISKLFKEIKEALQEHIDFRDVDWYKKLPQTIRFHLVKFVKRLDEEEMSVYHQKQIITKLIFGDLAFKYNDDAIREVQRVLNYVIQESGTDYQEDGHEVEDEEFQMEEVGQEENIANSTSEIDSEAGSDQPDDTLSRGSDGNEEEDDEDRSGPEFDEDRSEPEFDEEESEDDESRSNPKFSEDENSSSDEGGDEENSSSEEEVEDDQDEKSKNHKSKRHQYKLIKIGKTGKGSLKLFGKEKDRNLNLSSYHSKIAAMIGAGLRLKPELSNLASFKHYNPQMRCDEETLKTYRKEKRRNPGSRLRVEKIIMKNLHHFTNCSNFSTTTRNLIQLEEFSVYFDNFFSREYSAGAQISIGEHCERCCVAFIKCLKVILPIMRGLDVKKRASYIEQVRKLAMLVRDGLKNNGSSNGNIENAIPEILKILIDFVINNKFVNTNQEIKLEITQIILDNLHFIVNKKYNSLVEKSFDLIFESILDAKEVEEKLLNQVSCELVARININEKEYTIKGEPQFLEKLVEKFANSEGKDRIEGVAFKILRMIGDRFIAKIDDLGAKNDQNKIRDLINNLNKDTMTLHLNSLKSDPMSIMNLILKIAYIRCLVPAIDFSTQEELRGSLDTVVMECFDDDNITLAMYLIKFIRKRLGNVPMEQIEEEGFEDTAQRFRDVFDEEELMTQNPPVGEIEVLKKKTKTNSKSGKKTKGRNSIKAKEEIFRDNDEESSLSESQTFGITPSKDKKEIYRRLEAGLLRKIDLESEQITETEKVEMLLFRDTTNIEADNLQKCYMGSSEEQKLILKIDKYSLFLSKLPKYLELLVRVGLDMTEICSFVLTQEEVDSMKLIDFLKMSSDPIKNHIEQFLKDIKELFYSQPEKSENAKQVIKNLYEFLREEQRGEIIPEEELLTRIRDFSQVERAYNEMKVKDFLILDEMPESEDDKPLIAILIETCLRAHNGFLKLRQRIQDNKAAYKPRDIEKFDVKAIVSVNEKLIRIFAKHSYASLNPFKEATIKLDSPKFINEVLELVFRGRKPFLTLEENSPDFKFKPRVNPEKSSETMMKEYSEYVKFTGYKEEENKKEDQNEEKEPKEEMEEKEPKEEKDEKKKKSKKEKKDKKQKKDKKSKKDKKQKSDKKKKIEKEKKEIAPELPEGPGYEELPDGLLGLIKKIDQKEASDTISKIRNYIRAVLCLNRKWLNVELSSTINDWEVDLKLRQLRISDDFKTALEELPLNEIARLEKALKAKEDGRFNYEAPQVDIILFDDNENENLEKSEGSDGENDPTNPNTEEQSPKNSERSEERSDEGSEDELNGSSSYLDQQKYHFAEGGDRRV